MMLPFVMADAACVWTVRGRTPVSYRRTPVYQMVPVSRSKSISRRKRDLLKKSIFYWKLCWVWHKNTLQSPTNSSCSCTEIFFKKKKTSKAEITGNSLGKIQKEGRDDFFTHPRDELQCVHCTLKANTKVTQVSKLSENNWNADRLSFSGALSRVF